MCKHTNSSTHPVVPPPHRNVVLDGNPLLCRLQVYGYWWLPVTCICNVGSSGPPFNCTACVAGKYKALTGSAPCTDCGAGKFSNSTGATACTACSLGKYGNATGQTAEASCTACGAGKYGHTSRPCGAGMSTGTVRLEACRSDGCRVEVFVWDSWGTVCDDGWGTEETTETCLQLGCGVGTHSVPKFGGGSGPIWMDDVSCGSQFD